jgi:uncharacterized membrane protein (UPF0127 family)
MNLIMRLATELREWLFPRREPAAKKFLQAINLTRQTVVASCMEVAGSGSERTKGLLGRNSLAPGEGLWIIPCESVHTFFMRFPIDLVYLDRKHRIRKVRSNVGPWRLSACFWAHSVLELPAGTIRGTQTECGDVLEFSPVLSPVDSPSGGPVLAHPTGH